MHYKHSTDRNFTVTPTCSVPGKLQQTCSQNLHLVTTGGGGGHGTLNLPMHLANCYHISSE